MTNTDLTLIAALLDRSGSMQTCRYATQSGFDELINSQRNEPGECIVTLAQFDQSPEQPVLEWDYRVRPISEVGPLVLAPRGATPLLDAAGEFIKAIGDDLARLPEENRPGTVICLIMTDGYENASTEWSWSAIRALITQQTEVYSWKFLFLGANIDAEEVGAQMGVDRGSSLTYNAADGQAVMDSYVVASAAMGATRSGLHTSFTEEDRRRAAGKR